MIVAYDIGGTSIKCGIFKEDTLVEQWQIPTRTEGAGRFVLEDIANDLKDRITDFSTIDGIGFGVPGPVKGTLVLECANLGWRNMDVNETFNRYFETPFNVAVVNDANAAALGEFAHGAGVSARSMVMITLGTGVGGGIVINGRVLEGAHGAGGEIGHMHMKEDGFLCGCGQKGCLETLASATGVKNLANMYLEEGKLESRLAVGEDFAAKFVFTLAKNNDPLCMQVVEDMSYYLAIAAQRLAVTIDPDAFVFGGGVSQAGDYLFDKVKTKYRAHAFNAVKDILFIGASLGNDAGIYGAFEAVKRHG